MVVSDSKKIITLSHGRKFPWCWSHSFFIFLKQTPALGVCLKKIKNIVRIWWMSVIFVDAIHQTVTILTAVKPVPGNAWSCPRGWWTTLNLAGIGPSGWRGKCHPPSQQTLCPSKVYVSPYDTTESETKIQLYKFNGKNSFERTFTTNEHFH